MERVENRPSPLDMFRSFVFTEGGRRYLYRDPQKVHGPFLSLSPDEREVLLGTLFREMNVIDTNRPERESAERLLPRDKQ